jgi:hypothetical protein
MAWHAVADFVACKFVFKSLCESTVWVAVCFNTVDVIPVTLELNPSLQLYCGFNFYLNSYNLHNSH